MENPPPDTFAWDILASGEGAYFLNLPFDTYLQARMHKGPHGRGQAGILEVKDTGADPEGCVAVRT